MVTVSAPPYVPGVSEVPSYGARAPQDRKSPPLEAYQAHRRRYLTIDPARYTSAEEMQLEQDFLFPKVWLCAGLVADLPEVGSWLRFDMAKQSFIVVRSGESEFSAFWNVCQHRGNELVVQPFGKRRAFVCSYHSWSYDLRGKIKNVTDREFFDPEALCGNLDLPQVQCETSGGLIYINMDPAARPLSEYLGELSGIIDSYQLGKMHVVQDIVIELDCNWKAIMDAFSEAYHVHMTHPQVRDLAEDQKVQLDFYPGGHGRIITALGTPSSRWPVGEQLTPGLEFLLGESGVDPASFTGGPHDVRRACQLAKRQPDNIYGLDYSGFSDNQLTDSWVIDVFPNTQVTMHPEGVLTMRFLPHRTDPGKCIFHMIVAVPTFKEGRRPPFYMGVPPEADISGATRPERQYVSFTDPNLKDIIGELLWQDLNNVVQCQRGMESRGLKAIRLSEHEQRIQHQFAEIDRYLNPDHADV